MSFHGANRWFYGLYSDKALDKWVTKIAASGAKEAWIYFNNTADGSAIANAHFLKRIFLKNL